MEVAGCLLVFSGFNYLLRKVGWGFSKFWAAIGIGIFFFVYLNYRIYPPLPFSLRAIYGVVILCGIFLWVSGAQNHWEEFRRPVLNVLDGITGFHKGIRLFLVIIFPLVLGVLTFLTFLETFEEPIELRQPVPGAPRTTVVHGQIFQVQYTPNPFRVNKQGQYDPDYTDQLLLDRKGTRIIKDLNNPELNPWDPKAEGYIKSVRDGGFIYFQNCVFCHGADLNGRGMWAYAFQNPYPANIINYGEIILFSDSYRFWRLAQGGTGLPPEGFPWASTMPPFKEHLEINDIWKVVLFEFWHTGQPHQAYD